MPTMLGGTITSLAPIYLTHVDFLTLYNTFVEYSASAWIVPFTLLSVRALKNAAYDAFSLTLRTPLSASQPLYDVVVLGRVGMSVESLVDAHHGTIDQVLDLTFHEIRILTAPLDKMEERAKQLRMSDKGKRMERFLKDRM